MSPIIELTKVGIATAPTIRPTKNSDDKIIERLTEAFFDILSISKNSFKNFFYNQILPHLYSFVNINLLKNDKNIPKNKKAVRFEPPFLLLKLNITFVQFWFCRPYKAEALLEY